MDLQNNFSEINAIFVFRLAESNCQVSCAFTFFWLLTSKISFHHCNVMNLKMFVVLPSVPKQFQMFTPFASNL